jgi:hypothetical protein
MITECPPWVLAKVERLFLGECHEDAAKVKLCKLKEKEGRKEELIPIWVSKLNHSQENFFTLKQVKT